MVDMTDTVGPSSPACCKGDASPGSSGKARVLEEQRARLSSSGFMIRHSFIQAVPDVDEDACLHRGRCRSAPPGGRAVRSTSPARSVESDSRSAVSAAADLDHQNDMGAASETASEIDTDSEATSPSRTTTSDQASEMPRVKVSLVDSLFEVENASAGLARERRRSEPTSEELEFVEWVRESMSKMCSWLKVQKFKYHSTPEGGRGGSSGALVLLIQGMPWVRRAKWLSPLRLAVFNILELCGFQVNIILGHLYIAYPNNKPPLRMDFAPALSSNKRTQ